MSALEISPHVPRMRTASSEMTLTNDRAIDEEANIGIIERVEQEVEKEEEQFVRSWNRFLRKGKKQIPIGKSLKAFATSTWLNVFFVFIPLAWAGHIAFQHHPEKWPVWLEFALCFLALLPLAKLLEFGGEQLAFYCGKDIGDFIAVSLNNAIEATLAIILLLKCELRLLQSTIIGIVALHLLLIPGFAFFTGGARVMEQELHPHLAELNHTLLIIGVLTLLLPAAFFAAGGSVITDPVNNGTQAATDIVKAVVREASGTTVDDDVLKTAMLQMSRGLAVLLLCVYICSRIYLHDPPGEQDSLHELKDAPEELKKEEMRLMNQDPETNQWVTIAILLVALAIMAVTAEFLVDSIDPLREQGHIHIEWFGLILLPLVSFSADGVVAVGRFISHNFFGRRQPPTTMAHAQAIDLSVQFLLFWLPFLILLGWWTNKPLSLLFDLFEVAVIIGACFIVNYVTADAKTNYAEGFAMVVFYFMIAVCSWFYNGQQGIAQLLLCPGQSLES